MPVATMPMPVRTRTLTRRALVSPNSTRLAGLYVPARAMRMPDGGARVPESPPVLPPIGVVALNRMAFGPRPGDVDVFNALGTTDIQRLTNYVDQQLAPQSIQDTVCDGRIAAANFTTLNKTLTQMFIDHYVSDPPDWEDHIRPALETERAAWIRAAWSERQLLEVLVDLWQNHFNVYAYDEIEGATFVHYDRDVIRANALGNFRQMMEAVTKAPAMLYYLTNFVNFATQHPDGSPAGSNENYGREFLELHTMGSENSFGNLPRNQVPGYPNSQGYCQDDVVDVARALTGWTFAIDWISWACSEASANDGHFFNCDDQHDMLAKMILGTPIPANQSGAADGGAVMDRIASHPLVGKFVVRKMIRRLVNDVPPQSLVDSAGALFTAQWQAPDQLKQVVRFILLSNEFQTTWGAKIKRPFEIAISAMRAMQADFRFTLDQGPDRDDVDTLFWLYSAGGQELYANHPPNGYPDVRAAWQSANPRVALWRTVDWMVDVQDASQNWRAPLIATTLASPARSANEIVDFWIPRVFARTVPSGDRAEFVDFMAQGHNPDFPLPLDSNDGPEYTQDRLRSLVALMCMSPEFLWR